MKIHFYIWIIIGFLMLGSFIAYPDFAREIIPLALIIGGLLMRKLLFNYFYRYNQRYSSTTGTAKSSNCGANYQSGFSGWSRFASRAGWQGAGFGSFSGWSSYTGSGHQGGNFRAGSWNTSNKGQNTSSFYSQFKDWRGFQQFRGNLLDKDPHTVLGINNQATMEEIKKAYREKLKKFHPDVVEKLNLDPEYRELFEEKTMEIQRAYQLLGGK